MGKELFYTNEIKIGYFIGSAFQAPSSYLSRSPLEFRRILIHDISMSKRQLWFIGHGSILTLVLLNG